MNKIDVLNYLANDVKEKALTISRYNEAETKAREKAEKEHNYCWWDYLDWNITVPKKSQIKDNLKVIRRISLEIEKEL
jgi:hypothetical protein